LTPEQRSKEKAEALAGFDRSLRAILLFGDTHGSAESYAAVWDYLTKRPSPPGFDWIGLEMVTRDQKSILDDFIKGAEGSPQYKAAETKLLEYFRSGWDKRFADPKAPKEGHYFRILRWSRQHKIRVNALDSVSEYTLYRYGEFPLGATTRNIIWAEAIPLEGKGIVYGGSGHFVPLPATPFTFQDYVKRRDPRIEFFLVR